MYNVVYCIALYIVILCYVLYFVIYCSHVSIWSKFSKCNGHFVYAYNMCGSLANFFHICIPFDWEVYYTASLHCFFFVWKKYL